MPDGKRVIIGAVYIEDPTGPKKKPSIVDLSSPPPPTDLDAAHRRPRPR